MWGVSVEVTEASETVCVGVRVWAGEPLGKETVERDEESPARYRWECARRCVYVFVCERVCVCMRARVGVPCRAYLLSHTHLLKHPVWRHCLKTLSEDNVCRHCLQTVSFFSGEWRHSKRSIGNTDRCIAIDTDRYEWNFFSLPPSLPLYFHNSSQDIVLDLLRHRLKTSQHILKHYGVATISKAWHTVLRHRLKTVS